MGTREKWLLSILTGIFLIQTGVFVYGLQKCSNIKNPNASVTDVCPKIGERFDQTFGTMIATTLALLTGSSVATLAAKNNASNNPGSNPRTPITPPPGRQ